MIEGSEFRIAEQPGNLLQRDLLVLEITKSEAISQTIEDIGKIDALLKKPASK